MTDLESRNQAEFEQWFEREWPYKDLYWTDSSNRCFCTWSRFDPQPLWECWQAARAGNEEHLRLEIAVRKLAEKAEEEYFSDNQRLVKWNEELRECLRDCLVYVNEGDCETVSDYTKVRELRARAEALLERGK